MSTHGGGWFASPSQRWKATWYGRWFVVLLLWSRMCHSLQILYSDG